MGLHVWRLSSIMFSALTLSAAFAHLMELPAKMRYEPTLYVRLHRTLYPNFGRIAGVAEILGLVATGGLAWWVRKRRPEAFPLTVSAAGFLAAAHAAFWALVSPANKTMASWPLDAIPPEWRGWRNQWEYTHAVRAFLVMGALGALVSSALQETPDRAGAAANSRSFSRDVPTHEMVLDT